MSLLFCLIGWHRWRRRDDVPGKWCVRCWKTRHGGEDGTSEEQDQ